MAEIDKTVPKSASSKPFQKSASLDPRLKSFEDKSLDKYFRKNSCSVAEIVSKIRTARDILNSNLNHFLLVRADGKTILKNQSLQQPIKEIKINNWEDAQQITWSFGEKEEMTKTEIREIFDIQSFEELPVDPYAEFYSKSVELQSKGFMIKATGTNLSGNSDAFVGAMAIKVRTDWSQWKKVFVKKLRWLHSEGVCNSDSCHFEDMQRELEVSCLLLEKKIPHTARVIGIFKQEPEIHLNETDRKKVNALDKKEAQIFRERAIKYPAYCIVMERYEGDIESIVKNNDRFMTEEETLRMTLNIVEALEGLSKYLISHYDIKTLNIFYKTQEGKKVFFLGDFGSSGWHGQEQKQYTPHYESVTERDGRDYDLWSLGMVITRVGSRGQQLIDWQDVPFSGLTVNDFKMSNASNLFELKIASGALRTLLAKGSFRLILLVVLFCTFKGQRPPTHAEIKNLVNRMLDSLDSNQPNDQQSNEQQVLENVQEDDDGSLTLKKGKAKTSPGDENPQVLGGHFCPIRKAWEDMLRYVEKKAPEYNQLGDVQKLLKRMVVQDLNKNIKQSPLCQTIPKFHQNKTISEKLIILPLMSLAWGLVFCSAYCVL